MKVTTNPDCFFMGNNFSWHRLRIPSHGALLAGGELSIEHLILVGLFTSLLGYLQPFSRLGPGVHVFCLNARDIRAREKEPPDANCQEQSRNEDEKHHRQQQCRPGAKFEFVVWCGVFASFQGWDQKIITNRDQHNGKAEKKRHRRPVGTTGVMVPRTAGWDSAVQCGVLHVCFSSCGPCHEQLE